MNPSNQLMKEIEANLKSLASETDDFKKSEFFKNYLETMSKFWQYSYHNQLLILFQKPEATKVAGFKKWQELNRKVLKGQKAIKILAPFTKKITELKPGTLEEVEKEITLFFPVSVFDISQTDGEQLPEISISIQGDSYKGFLQNLLSFCEQNHIKVNFKNLGINGVYGYSKGGEIAVSNSKSINTQVNTMIHEIAHELLHNSKDLSKQQKEIQAEGTAYVVTKHFGLENKSFNYLALYDADYHKIMENLKAIAEASKEIIEFLEGSHERLQKYLYKPSYPKNGSKMKEIKFKSKKDGKEFNLKVPESSEEIENNEFIEIGGKTKFVEEVEDYDATISENVRNNGELVFGVDEVYDLYYFNGEFYEFYWDTASGCIFAKLKDEP